MKIAISGDCLSVFTSAYPVRGMLLELIKQRQDDLFIIFYTQRPRPKMLKSFFEQLHALPNVKTRYFKWNRYVVGLQRFLTLSNYFPIDNSYDIFINPSYLEYVRAFKGVQIANITDLSILHSQASIPHAKIWKLQNKFAKSFYFRLKDLNVVSISEYTKQDIHRYFKRVNTRINVIYNGIDDFWFDNHYIENSLTNQYQNRAYFIWWGFMSRRKNLINMLLAYEELVKEKCEVSDMLIIGNIAEHLKKEITPLMERNAKIIHLPFQEEYVLKTLVKNSKGLIFPSFYEGFGLPVIEAYSQGVPVACSNVTSLPEIANGFSFLFDPNNRIEIKEAFLHLLNFNKESNSPLLIQYARQFTYKKAAEAYNKLINKMV